MKIRKHAHLPPGKRVQSTKRKLPLFERAPEKAVSTGPHKRNKLRGSFRDEAARTGEGWLLMTDSEFQKVQR